MAQTTIIQTRFAVADARLAGLARLIVLHLLPGAIGALIYFTVAPLLIPFGVPPLLTLLLVLTPVIAILELGHLLRSRPPGARGLSLAGVVDLSRGRMPTRRAALLVLAMVSYSIAVLILLYPLENQLATTLFAWLPDWAIRTDVSQYAAFTRPMLVVTFALMLLLNGIVGPVIEELYFRGFLLPRLAPIGRGAPWLHAVLFALYHFWQPWEYLSVLLFALPLTFVPWRTGNVRLAMIAHCTINLLGNTLIAARILGSA
jgi:CAAX protease family protein